MAAMPMPVLPLVSSNVDAREDVALGNTLAGMVEATANCISMHAMEHAMSAYHPKLPHGAGLIMLCRAYYTKFAQSGAVDDRLIDMAKAMGKQDASCAMDVVAALDELMQACGVADLKMSDYGITEDELPMLTKNARETMGGLFYGDPIKLTDEEVTEIYSSAFA